MPGSSPWGIFPVGGSFGCGLFPFGDRLAPVRTGPALAAGGQDRTLVGP